MEYFLFESCVVSPQEAWFWPIVPIVISLIGLLTTIIIIGKPKRVEGGKIAILGMQGAGKTQFLANIRGLAYSKYDATVGNNNIDSFKIQLGNRIVKIKKANDIGGGEELIKNYYKDLMSNSDIIFFFFNSYEYINEIKYRNDTQARLEFVNRYRGGKATVIFATFADKFRNKSNRKDAYSKIFESVQSKDYAEIFKYNFFVLDMRERDKLMELLNKKIFC